MTLLPNKGATGPKHRLAAALEHQISAATVEVPQSRVCDGGVDAGGWPN